MVRTASEILLHKMCTWGILILPSIFSLSMNVVIPWWLEWLATIKSRTIQMLIGFSCLSSGRSYFYDAICLSLSMVLDSGVVSYVLVNGVLFVWLIVIKVLVGSILWTQSPNFLCLPICYWYFPLTVGPLILPSFSSPNSEFQISFTRKN